MNEFLKSTRDSTSVSTDSTDSSYSVMRDNRECLSSLPLCFNVLPSEKHCTAMPLLGR